MTTLFHNPDPHRFHSPDYVVVFGHENDGNESRFRAASDENATDLMQKNYPDQRWTLYRIAGGERWHVHMHHGREIPAADDASIKTNPEAAA